MVEQISGSGTALLNELEASPHLVTVAPVISTLGISSSFLSTPSMKDTPVELMAIANLLKGSGGPVDEVCFSLCDRILVIFYYGAIMMEFYAIGLFSIKKNNKTCQACFHKKRLCLKTHLTA